jgi:hypothetical protein
MISQYIQPNKKNKPRKFPKLNKTIQPEEDDDPDAPTKMGFNKRR